MLGCTVEDHSHFPGFLCTDYSMVRKIPDLVVLNVCFLRRNFLWKLPYHIHTPLSTGSTYLLASASRRYSRHDCMGSRSMKWKISRWYNFFDRTGILYKASSESSRWTPPMNWLYVVTVDRHSIWTCQFAFPSYRSMLLIGSITA